MVRLKTIIRGAIVVREKTMRNPWRNGIACPAFWKIFASDGECIGEGRDCLSRCFDEKKTGAEASVFDDDRDG
jgi:hypothetical protein